MSFSWSSASGSKALQVANIQLAIENLDLRESADEKITGEYDRLVEALLLVEAWVWAGIADGGHSVDAEALLRVLGECFEWSENNLRPPWYGAASEAMDGRSSS